MYIFFLFFILELFFLFSDSVHESSIYDTQELLVIPHTEIIPSTGINTHW